jgi:hypothetical protein
LTLLKVDAGLTPIEWKSSKKAEVGDWVRHGTGENPIAVGVIGVAARMPGSRPVPSVPPGASGFARRADRRRGRGQDRPVTKDTAADRAGLKVGDIIVSIDGKAIDSPEALKATLGKKKPGDTVTIRSKRDDEEKSLKATLGRWPRNWRRADEQAGQRAERSPHRLPEHPAVRRRHQAGGLRRAVGGPRRQGSRHQRLARPHRDVRHPSDAVLRLDDLKSGKLAKTEKPQNN